MRPASPQSRDEHWTPKNGPALTHVHAMGLGVVHEVHHQFNEADNHSRYKTKKRDEYVHMEM